MLVTLRKTEIDCISGGTNSSAGSTLFNMGMQTFLAYMVGSSIYSQIVAATFLHVACKSLIEFVDAKANGNVDISFTDKCRDVLLGDINALNRDAIWITLFGMNRWFCIHAVIRRLAPQYHGALEAFFCC